MDVKEILGFITVALAFIVYVPYYYTIFKGRTKPHVYTYLVGGIVGVIAFVGSFTSGGGAGAWNVGFSAALTLGVFVLALKYGTKDIKPIDKVLTAGALAAIGLWLITDDLLLSVMLASAIDAIGMMPTIRKTWSDPCSEPYEAWGLNTLKHVLAIFALSQVSLITVIYPATMILMYGILSIMTYIKQKAL